MSACVVYKYYCLIFIRVTNLKAFVLDDVLVSVDHIKPSGAVVVYLVAYEQTATFHERNLKAYQLGL